MTDAADPIPLVTAADSAADRNDVIADNIAALKRLFPAVLTDGKVDFDVLRQLLGDAVEDGEERYGLMWKGKRRARAFALTPSLGTLRPAREDSVDWETTGNIFVEGDNLEVLKALRKSYAGRIRLIYIDPPYNTGKDFIYKDDYKNSIPSYEIITGQRDADGTQMISETASNGRFHTDWLNMMYPRLMLAKDLLTWNGVFCMSIDQNEVSNARLLLDDVFGYGTLVAEVTVVNNLKGRNDRANVAITHECLIIHAKTPGVAIGTLPLSDEQRAVFKYKDETDSLYALRDLRKRGGPDRREDRPQMWFPIFWDEMAERASITRSSDNQVEITPKRGDDSDGCWRWGKDRVSKHIDQIAARKNNRGGWTVEHRVYLNVADDIEDSESEDEEDEVEIERSSKPKSVWAGPEFSTDAGQRTVKRLLGTGVFTFPKSMGLLERIIQIGMGPTDIMLDFFCGSGTTGHAVMAKNAEDGGQRRTILVQLPEVVDPTNKAQKIPAAFCDHINKPRTIAEITKERLRRASAKLRADNPTASFDKGFRTYKLASSNLKPWQPDPDNLQASLLDAVDNVLPDRTEDDLLVELLLKTGIDLSLPSEERNIASVNVHALGGGVLMVCLANVTEDQAEALGQGMCDWRAELDPPRATTFYFKDSGFESAATKANLAAIIRQRVGTGVEKLASI